MYYIWKNNGNIVYADSVERARALYGVTGEPDATVESFERAPVLIDGKIVTEWTDEEKKEMERGKLREELTELHAKLVATDYIAAKIAEGAATREEYAEQLEERQKWRGRINEIEGQLK